MALTNSCHLVSHVRKGDVIAIPKGWTYWAWNDQKNKTIKFISVADTSSGPVHGAYTTFSLIGAKKEYIGGLLHGFRFFMEISN